MTRTRRTNGRRPPAPGTTRVAVLISPEVHGRLWELARSERRKPGAQVEHLIEQAWASIQEKSSTQSGVAGG